MSEKMREEFESWYWAKLHGDRNVSLRRAVFNKTSDGSYRGLKCDTAWCAWKASRAALVVELPAQWSNQCYDDEIMFSGQVIDAIDSAGISYK